MRVCFYTCSRFLIFCNLQKIEHVVKTCSNATELRFAGNLISNPLMGGAKMRKSDQKCWTPLSPLADLYQKLMVSEPSLLGRSYLLEGECQVILHHLSGASRGRLRKSPKNEWNKPQEGSVPPSHLFQSIRLVPPNSNKLPKMRKVKNACFQGFPSFCFMEPPGN